MRTRLAAWSLPFLLPLALIAGCAGDDPGDPVATDTGTNEPGASEPGATEPSGPRTLGAGAAGGPVAGSGAAVDPDDQRAWCRVVTPAQASALTGYESTRIVVGGGDCAAEIEGEVLSVGWRTSETADTLADLVATWGALDNMEIEEVVLAGGEKAVVQVIPTASLASVATIVDGRQVEASVMVADPSTGVTTEQATDMAAALVAAYLP